MNSDSDQRALDWAFGKGLFWGAVMTMTVWTGLDWVLAL